MMNQCMVRKSNFAACEDIWSRSVEKKDTVVCPKPRRLGLVHTTVEPSYMRPLRWHVSYQQEDCDAKASNELLDIILAKGGHGSDQQSIAQLSSSPPFFNGSPPSRVSNPLIQDSRFRDQEKSIPLNASPRSTVQSPSSSSTRKASGGCVRAMSFGNNPAVRIEGFDCRGQRNCSIPALA